MNEEKGGYKFKNTSLREPQDSKHIEAAREIGSEIVNYSPSERVEMVQQIHAIVKDSIRNEHEECLKHAEYLNMQIEKMNK